MNAFSFVSPPLGDEGTGCLFLLSFFCLPPLSSSSFPLFWRGGQEGRRLGCPNLTLRSWGQDRLLLEKRCCP